MRGKIELEQRSVLEYSTKVCDTTHQNFALRMSVGLTPQKTLLGPIVISYVKLFLNNNKKPQMDGCSRSEYQIFWGGQSNASRFIIENLLHHVKMTPSNLLQKKTEARTGKEFSRHLLPHGSARPANHAPETSVAQLLRRRGGG